MNEKPACFNIWPPGLLQLQFMAWREDAFCHCLSVEGGSNTNRLHSKLFQNFLGHHVIHLLLLSKIVLSLLSFRKMGASLLADLKNSAKVFKEQVLLDLFHQHFQWLYMLSTAKYFLTLHLYLFPSQLSNPRKKCKTLISQLEQPGLNIIEFSY